MSIIRRLALSGPSFSDADWTDPAVNPPDNARRFEIVAQEVVFELLGLDGTAAGSDLQDVGTLEVDAWVGYEGPAYGDPPVVSITRGLSIVEATSAALSGRIRFVASDCTPGDVGRLHLDLTSAGALPAVQVRIVRGARAL